jgi:hypothetical protein
MELLQQNLSLLECCPIDDSSPPVSKPCHHWRQHWRPVLE